MRSAHVRVTIDLGHIRSAALQVCATTERPMIAVIKADAYGLGAAAVASAIEDVACEFAYFSLAEAREVGRPGIALGPPDAAPAAFRELRVRPSIGRDEDATKFADTSVAINLDTGMQRFGCDQQQLRLLLKMGNVFDVFTHAADPGAAEQLAAAVADWDVRRHAACSSLLNHPVAYLDAVRPGLALYRGAVRATTPIHNVRTTRGDIGYTGFHAERVGVILAGYAHGLRPAPIAINGKPQRILEVGMNTSYVTLDPDDGSGDDVELLGAEITEATLATELGVRPHEVLCRYCGMGMREYLHVQRSTTLETTLPIKVVEKRPVENAPSLATNGGSN